MFKKFQMQYTEYCCVTRMNVRQLKLGKKWLTNANLGTLWAHSTETQYNPLVLEDFQIVSRCVNLVVVRHDGQKLWYLELCIMLPLVTDIVGKAAYQW